MNVKKLSKTIVTALAITVLGISGLGLTAYAHDGEATPITVYRLYNPNNSEHLYTNNSGEKDYLDNNGWNYEGIAFTALSDG